MREGMRVTLRMGIPALDGKTGLVVELRQGPAEHGSVPYMLVKTPAAASGYVRCLPEEVEEAQRRAEYVGDPCPTCSSMTLRRNGACLQCDTCYNTTGCS